VKTWSKSVQIFLACFMTIHECLVPFSSRTLHFEEWRGVCGVKNCCDYTFFRFLSTRIHEKVVQKCPQFSSAFYDRTLVLGPIFKSYMLHFSGRRGLEGSKTAVITRFVLSLSTRIHVIVMERRQH